MAFPQRGSRAGSVQMASFTEGRKKGEGRRLGRGYEVSDFAATEAEEGRKTPGLRIRGFGGGGSEGFDWSPTTYISLYSVMTETRYRTLIEKMLLLLPTYVVMYVQCARSTQSAFSSSRSCPTNTLVNSGIA